MVPAWGEDGGGGPSAHREPSGDPGLDRRTFRKLLVSHSEVIWVPSVVLTECGEHNIGSVVMIVWRTLHRFCCYDSVENVT